MTFDPRYDTPVTEDQCKQSEKAFLRRFGLKNMDELIRIFEECDYDQETIFRKLGIEGSAIVSMPREVQI